MPGAYDFDEDDAGKHCALTESINSALKYIKAYNIDKSMWFFYERKILEGENIEDIIRRMIFHLQAGLLVLRKTIDSYDSNGEDEDDGDTAKR